MTTTDTNERIAQLVQQNKSIFPFTKTAAIIDFEGFKSQLETVDASVSSLTETLALIIASLSSKVDSLTDIVKSGELGKVHATSLTSDTVPMIQNSSIYRTGPEDPSLHGLVPDFLGQIYVSTDASVNRKVYIARNNLVASDWVEVGSTTAATAGA